MTKRDKLIKLRKKALEADLPLKESATKLVFGAGNPNAEILFIGEGPGYWEDIKGIPFVGNAGKLLDQTLNAIGVKRDDVFITNVIMYRPPENRDPQPCELAAFEPYIDGIVEIISPKILCTLGRYSMGKFLPGVYISQVHGHPRNIKWHNLTFTVMPMYHPAAALRNGNTKAEFVNDFKKLPEIIKGNELPKEVVEKGDNMDNVDQMNLI